jgi:hypothetical protein
MNCKEFELTVSDLAGEQLIEASKYKLALAHKNSCAPCAARLANERSLTKALQVTANAETEQASAHTKAALLKAFAERTLPSSAPRALSAIEVAPNSSSSNVKLSAPAVEIQPAPVNKVINISVPRAQKQTRWTWLAAAAVIIALLTIAAMSLIQSHKTETPLEVSGDEQKSVQPQEAPKPQNENLGVPDNPNPQPQKFIGKSAPQRVNQAQAEQIARTNKPSRIERSKENEVTTDYIPLSYVSDATAMGSGHVVRMMV